MNEELTKVQKKKGSPPLKVQKQRLNTVMELDVNGLTPAQIHQYVNNPPINQKTGLPQFEAWDISINAIYQYLKRVNILLAKEARDINIEKEIGSVLKRYNQLYALALKDGDKAEARATTKAKCELLGLEAPKRQQIDVTSKGQSIGPDYSNWSDEDLRTLHEIQERNRVKVIETTGETVAE
jgi:hypothetical protein